MRPAFVITAGALLALATLVPLTPGTASATSVTPTGRTGTMPAIYDSMLLTINAQQISPTAAAPILANNPDLHLLFFSEATLPDGSMFVTVLGAKPGDAFNPLWKRTEIIFNAGVTPRQFFSDDEVMGAATDGLITLRDTGLLFRCSVIGPQTRLGRAGARSTGTPSSWGALKARFAR